MENSVTTSLGFFRLQFHAKFLYDYFLGYSGDKIVELCQVFNILISVLCVIMLHSNLYI
jgi:hypothetical protein